MNRTRLAAAAVLGLVVIAAACTAKQNNGEECLKNFDCESDRCVQYVCVDPAGQRAPTTDAATEAAADAADTTPPPVDTGTDTGSGDTAPETPADASSD